MFNRVDAKQEAKLLRRESRPAAWAVTLFFMLFTGAFGFLISRNQIAMEYGEPSFLLGLLAIGANILTMYLSYGYNCSWAVNVARKQPADYGNLFDGFRNAVQIFLLYLLMWIYTFLWSLLFLIPGIIKGFSYAMAPYILRDNPGMPVNEAITRSREMMDGHKLELFVLQLSFFGWLILIPFTLGILSLWVVPYMAITTALFYDAISGGKPVKKPSNGFREVGGVEDEGTYTMATFDEGTNEFREVPDDKLDD